jgi:hypothetical protein
MMCGVSLQPRRILALTGLTLVLRSPSFFRTFMDIDEGSYAAIACRMLSGGLPYRDGVENKFPGIFYVYRAIYGLFGRYNQVAVHAVTALVALSTALVCGAIARRVAVELGKDGARASFAASLGYVVFSTVYYPKMLAGNTEMFVVLPCALALYCYLRARERPWLYLVVGALAGVSTLLKQVAGAVLGAVGADRMLRGGFSVRGFLRAAAELLLVALGFAAVLGGAYFLLQRARIFDDAKFWTWTYIFRHYIPSGNRDHGFAFNLLTNLLPFLLTVSPLIFLAWRARVREAAPIWWWLGAMLGASLIGGRMYGHYFLMMLPALSVLAGVGAADGLPRPLLWVSGGLAFSFLVYACLYEAATGSFWSPKPDYRRAGAYVQAHTRPDERIFVWGWFPPLYQAADRCPSTRFVYTHVLSGSASSGGEARGHTVPEGWDMLMHDLDAAPPPYLLDTSHGDYSYQYAALEQFPRLWDWVRARYDLETELAGVRIYKRR